VQKHTDFFPQLYSKMCMRKLHNNGNVDKGSSKIHQKFILFKVCPKLRLFLRQKYTFIRSKSMKNPKYIYIFLFQRIHFFQISPNVHEEDP
jgi:hypothetical protein